ncbi:hypothetical protein AAG906_035819 [Vitis piasezkii]
MNCRTTKEAWDKLKLEYQGNSDIIALIVNKTRLLGEEFSDARIMEMVLVTLPERFESKISSLEESRDLSQISFAELMNVLQAQEQRRALRQENVTKDSYNAWLIDSGCTHHMCHNATIFKDLDKTYNSTVKVGNGGYMDVKGRDTIAVETNSDNQCIIFNPYGEKLLCMKMKSKSFAINWENAIEYAYVGVTQSVSDIWHKWFGHYNQRA